MVTPFPVSPAQAVVAAAMFILVLVPNVFTVVAFTFTCSNCVPVPATIFVQTVPGAAGYII